MADKNFMRDFSVDEILDEVKRMNGEDSEQRLWSLAEIDALLADDAENGSVSLPFSSEEENDEHIVKETQERTEETAQEQLSVNSSEETNIPEENIAEPGDVSEKEASEDSLGLIEFAKRKGVIEKSGAETEIAQETDFPEETESSEDTEISEKAEHFEGTDENRESPSSQEAEDDIEPLIDSAQDSEANGVSESAEEEKPADVPGQISIEKTRVFNEVEARAVRSEGIKHHIGEKKILRTGEIPKGKGMETDPYRERFLNKPTLNIEKTLEHKELISKRPAKTVEKHGVVVKKSTTDKTTEDGLLPIPTLIDAADEYDAQQRLEMQEQGGNPAEEQLDNQIVLDGFGSEDEVEIVSEAEAEEKLRRVRRDKVSKFRLFPNLEQSPEEYEAIEDEPTDVEEADDETEEDNEGTVTDAAGENGGEAEAEQKEEQEKIRVAREFFGPKDSKAVYGIYLEELRKCRAKIIAASVIFALLLLSSIITSTFGSFALFADNPLVYSVICIILLAVTALLNGSAVKRSLLRLKKKKADADTAITVSLAAGLLQSLVSLGFSDLVASGTHLYAAVAVLPVLLINISQLIKIKNDINNFILLNTEHGKFYAVKEIKDDDTAFEIGRGLMIKDPDIRYGAKVDFPCKFVEMSKTADPTADMFKLVLPVAAIAAAFVGIVSWIVNKSLFIAVSSFTGLLLMAIPSAAVVSAYGLLSRVNKALNAEGGMISGYEAVDNALTANAAVFDASKLFSDGGAALYYIKPFNSMRIDEAILSTAAVVIQSGGALTEVFDGIFLSNRDEMLPQVESLAYEEKLGCSGWIRNYRVLVGNRDLLLKHNVEVQSKQEESMFTRDGKKAIYLAVEGKVAAMFLVGYHADRETAEYMQKLEKAGVNILIRTTDANISEDMVEQQFGLPRNFVKVISPVAGVMFNKLCDEKVENEPCRILHNGKTNSFLRSFVSAFLLNDQRKLGLVLQYIGIGIGILIMALFSFTSALGQADALRITLFEALWSLIVIFVPRIKKI